MGISKRFLVQVLAGIATVLFLYYFFIAVPQRGETVIEVTRVVTRMVYITPVPLDTQTAEPQSFMVDGEYVVGRDILPRAYITTVPEDSKGCVWSIWGPFNGIIAQKWQEGFASPGEQQAVFIEPTASMFITRGCGTWVGYIA